MAEVVAPNILRHRTGELALRVLDPLGRPVQGATVAVEQEDLRFGIGSALNHFAEPAAHSHEFRAPRVDERELDLFREVFNASVIGYAGKWSVIEPTRGTRNTSSLDAYVDWCVRHGIRLEFHFVSGYRPPWVEDMRNRAEREAALLAHATDLIDRYGDRILDWQVINEDVMRDEIGPVFALFRERLPAARLGAGYCTRFYSEREGDLKIRDLLRGMRSLEGLAASAAGVDFVAAHGHRPFGLWADPRVIYEVFDAYQAQGIRVHVSEFGVPYAGPIQGGVLSGVWDETLQAEYLNRFLKIAYSHPNVDMVNLWGFGPRNWQANIGLLDSDYQPRPAFHSLRALVRGEWWTQDEFTSDSDGWVRFRGHHGRYRARIALPDGRSWEERVDFAPDTPGPWQVRPAGP